MRRVDLILEDILSCRKDDSQGDKRICVDLRILWHIHSTRVGDLSRICFEQKRQIRHIAIP